MLNPQNPNIRPHWHKNLRELWRAHSGKGVNERKETHENPPEHREVPPERIPTRCARSKTDAPPAKNIRSDGRSDSGPHPRDTRSDDRRLDSGGRIAEQDRQVSAAVRACGK